MKEIMVRDEDLLRHYMAALDEIYRARIAAAYEAHVVNGVLAYVSLPKGARTQLEWARERLLMVARGDTAAAIADVGSELRQRVLENADAPTTLTRSEWEARYREPTVVSTPFGDVRVRAADLPDGVAFMAVGHRQPDDTDEDFVGRCAVVREEPEHG